MTMLTQNKAPETAKRRSPMSLVFGATVVGASAAMVLTLGMVASAPVSAQSDVQGPAGERKPIEIPGRKGGNAYEALGWRRGAFLIFPHLRLGFEDDDNIFADDTRVVSDNIFTINPGFTATSIWNTHELEFWGDANFANYSDVSTEDHDDWNLGVAGRIDRDRNSFVSLSAELGEASQDRADPTDEGFDEPSSYDFMDLRAGWYQQFNRLYYRVGARYYDEDFKNFTVDDEVLNNDDQDFDRTLISGEIGYEFQTDYWAFVRAEFEDTDYGLPLDDQGINRDSSGDSLLAGISVKLQDRIAGSAYVGRRSRDYDDADDISGSVFGGSLKWEPSRLTTISVDADRRIFDALSTNTTGYKRRSFGISADHELYRNFELSAGIGWTDDDYAGIDRDDDGFTWKLGGKYLPNRWSRIGLEFIHDDRDSKGADALPGNSYDRDVIRLTLELVR